MARRAIGLPTARRSCAVDATDGSTLLNHDVCPSSKEKAVIAVASEVGARDYNQENDTVQASAFKAEEKGKNDACSGEGEPAWQVGDEA